MEIPVEKKFKILCEITRASHFAWRQAVVETCPDTDIKDVVYKLRPLISIQSPFFRIWRLEKTKINIQNKTTYYMASTTKTPKE